ncbi:MAG: hypothetical protein ABI151_03120, partial [Chitinophagaceae bacterium]
LPAKRAKIIHCEPTHSMRRFAVANTGSLLLSARKADARPAPTRQTLHDQNKHPNADVSLARTTKTHTITKQFIP